MYSAEKIAKWFLARNKMDFNFGYTDECITNLKLQKLLYYAQGCVLALTNSPLFSEEIQAWEHGPVVPELYSKYKVYGRNGIEFNEQYDEKEIDEAIRGILETVYREFGQFSAWKLRDMTHQETPWKTTQKNSNISNDVIKEYFKTHYVEE